ncbi:MAG TPA: hemolysin family protein [Bryobacteraceae bacterium]|jgi:CBS domain containing-hemolysin-like protein|nr:hemolysin family protein [Bryobacteraceae bacterium]
MTLALVVLIAVFSLLLGLVSFVQLLYLESLRLRTRDFPALKFFKENLEDKIGFPAEDGAGVFTLVKHTTILLTTILYFLMFADGQAWTWPEVLETAAASWLTMIVTAYVLPQVLYRRTAAQWLTPLARLVRYVGLIAKPCVAVLSFFQSLVELTDESNGTEEPPTQAENIEALISAGAEEGLIEEEDRKLIQSVVEFGDKVVREVMTPRPNVVAISASATLDELRQLVINEQYSRIPVYEGTIDQIIGFVHVRDMFELDEDERASRTVRELIRPIRFVPETKPVNDLMREMQQDNTHMVIVVDEYGNTAGLASMEDLVEVILGEIRDEHEPDSDVQEDGQGGYIVSGSFDVARLGDLLEFHPDEEIESTTVGGLVTEWLGRVPQSGESVERDGIHIDVLASDELRVAQVRVRRAQPVTP